MEPDFDTTTTGGGEDAACAFCEALVRRGVDVDLAVCMIRGAPWYRAMTTFEQHVYRTTAADATDAVLLLVGLLESAGLGVLRPLKE